MDTLEIGVGKLFELNISDVCELLFCISCSMFCLVNYTTLILGLPCSDLVSLVSDYLVLFISSSEYTYYYTCWEGLKQNISLKPLILPKKQFKTNLFLFNSSATIMVGWEARLELLSPLKEPSGNCQMTLIIQNSSHGI